MGKKKKAGLYIRVSTHNQVDKQSLITQEERLRTYCKLEEFDVFRVYEDAGYSGKDTNRPGFKALQRDCRAGRLDVVCITKLDRITRSIRDLLDLVTFLDDHNVDFSSLSERIDSTTAMGRFMRNLLGSLAQLEREVTSERVTTDMYHKASKGHWCGGPPPYGYGLQTTLKKQLIEAGKEEADALKEAVERYPEKGKLYIIPEEASVVRLIFDLYLQHNSVRKVVLELNDRGYRTKEGELWHPSTIERFLTTVTYIGKVRYGRRKTNPVTGKIFVQDKDDWIIVDGVHEAIVDESIFEKAQKKRKVREKPAKTGRIYLLKGLVKCGLCGGTMSGAMHHRKYPYYRCNKSSAKKSCKGMSIRSDVLEQAVIEKLLSLSHDKDFLLDKQRIIEGVKQRLESIDSKQELDRIERQKKRVKRQCDVLLDKLQKELIEDEDFEPRYRALKQELITLDESREHLLDREQHDFSIVENLTISFEEIANFGTNWEFLDDTGKMAKIQAIVKEIRVLDDGQDSIEIDLYTETFKNLSHTLGHAG